MITLTIYTIAIWAMMFISWIWKPMPLWIQMFLLMIIILEASCKIIEAIDREKRGKK